MFDDLRVFDFNDKSIGVMDVDGELWFIAKDVCRALGLNNTSQAVSSLPQDEKGITIVYTPGGKQKVRTISEPGVYRLTAKSIRPEAKEFTNWVYKTVLPSIRRTGSYSTDVCSPAEHILAMATQLVEHEKRIGAIDTWRGGIDERVTSLEKVRKLPDIESNEDEDLLN